MGFVEIEQEFGKTTNYEIGSKFEDFFWLLEIGGKIGEIVSEATGCKWGSSRNLSNEKNSS